MYTHAYRYIHTISESNSNRVGEFLNKYTKIYDNTVRMFRCESQTAILKFRAIKIDDQLVEEFRQLRAHLCTHFVLT